MVNTRFQHLKLITALVLSFSPLLCVNAQTDWSFNKNDAAYERITRLDDYALSADADRFYAFVKEPDQALMLIRIDLNSGKQEILLSPLKGNLGRLYLGPKEQRLLFVSDLVGDERHKLQILDLASRHIISPTPPGALDLPCGFSPDGMHVYAARGSKLWGERSIVRISVKTGKAKTLLKIPGAGLLCADVSDSHLLTKNFINNDEQHLGVLDLKSGDVDWLLKEPDVRVPEAMFHENSIYFLSNLKAGVIGLWRYEQNTGIKPVNLPVHSDIQTFFLTNKGYLSLTYRGALKSIAQLFRSTGNGDWQAVMTGANIEHTFNILPANNSTKRFLVITDDGRPPVLHVSENGKLLTLLDSDQSGLPETAFARFQSHLVESFDGTKIPTHILVPSNATAKTPLPMILWVHGGPQDHVDPDYSTVFQRLANNGFVVVIPNVRGSSGFGQKFRNLDNGDWGGAHIRDLIAVSEFASKLDYIAERPRFIMGGSFGGFSVLSAISQYPDSFDGAIDIFGVVDIESFIQGLPEQARPYFIDELGFDPIKEPERARAISPLYQARNIKIPVQIHQGIHDPRVLPEQSRMMVSALKRNGVKVEYFEYDEGHGFTRGNNDLVARQRMLDFLKRLSGTE